jgi:NAD(P)-dependent dehydrogenase (short-subunit alcohol dehydrogenase family)
MSGKIAFLTGGASGIGRAVGEVLARRGDTVVLADINEPAAEQAAAAIRAQGGKAEAVRLDVTDAEAVRELVERTAAAHGRLDLMFNNAGIALIGEARHLELKDWERVLDVNLRGVLHGVTASYALMIRQGHGHIVSTASLAGLIPSPALVAYGMTKHAIVGLSVSLRPEAALHGVRVSVVCPGFVDTPIKSNADYRSLDRETMERAIPFMSYPVERCARVIVRGIDRNLGIIPVTGHARFFWALWRLSPRLMLRLSGLQLGQILKQARRS